MTHPLSLDIQVPLASAAEAQIVFGTLTVDVEPKRGGTKKTFEVEDCILHIHFTAKEARKLRVAVNSFFDHLNLVVKTMDKFGPPHLPVVQNSFNIRQNN